MCVRKRDCPDPISQLLKDTVRFYHTEMRVTPAETQIFFIEGDGNELAVRIMNQYFDTLDFKPTGTMWIHGPGLGWNEQEAITEMERLNLLLQIDQM